MGKVDIVQLPTGCESVDLFFSGHLTVIWHYFRDHLVNEHSVVYLGFTIGATIMATEWE